MTLTQHLLALLVRVSIGLWSGLRAEPQLSDLSSNRFCSWCHLEDSTLTEGQRSPISQESFGENDCQFLGTHILKETKVLFFFLPVCTTPECLLCPDSNVSVIHSEW